MASNAVCVHGASRRHHPQNACLTTNTLPPRSPMCFRFAPTSTHVPDGRCNRPIGRPPRPHPGVFGSPAPRRCWSPSPSGQGSCRVRTCPVRSTRVTASCPCPSAAPNARATHGGDSVCEEAPLRPALAAAGGGRQWCWHFANAWRRFRMLPAQGMCAARPGRFSVGVRGVGRAVCGSGYSAVGLHVRRRL